MQRRFTTLITAGITTSMLSFTLATPASAQLLEDIGIGAAAGSATGVVIGDDTGFDDAINGAAAGAAVSVLGRDDSSLVRDIAVGAIAGGLAGTLTNDDSFLENAAQGAAAGAAVSTFGKDSDLAQQISEQLLGRSSRSSNRNIFGRGGAGRRILGGVLGRTILDRTLGGGGNIFGF